MAKSDCKQKTVAVAGTELCYLKAGKGKPVLVLHEELGNPGWLAWQRELAETRKLILPLHPGFGVSPRVEWIRSVRDLANFYAQVLVEQDWVGADVIGFSFGGWIAAEMAAQNPGQFASLTLVAPLGIRPPQGVIRDLFEAPTEDYLAASVKDAAATAEFGQLFGGAVTPEQFERFQDATAEAARLAWQPYMNDPSLHYRLGLVRDLPTLIVWGEDDAIVPVSAAGLYRDAIRDARLALFDNCGHRPELEQPARFLKKLRNHLS
ncbi:MAG: alpha/beta fold hydrolase [Pseudomonadota bacterium]